MAKHPLQGSPYYYSSEYYGCDKSNIPPLQGRANESQQGEYIPIQIQIIRGDGNDDPPETPKPDDYYFQNAFTSVELQKLWYLTNKIRIQGSGTYSFVRRTFHKHYTLVDPYPFPPYYSYNIESWYEYEECSGSFSFNEIFDIGAKYYAQNDVENIPHRPMGQLRYESTLKSGSGFYSSFFAGHYAAGSPDEEGIEYLTVFSGDLRIEIIFRIFDDLIFQKNDHSFYPSISLGPCFSDTVNRQELIINQESETHHQNIPFFGDVYGDDFVAIYDDDYQSGRFPSAYGYGSGNIGVWIPTEEEAENPDPDRFTYQEFNAEVFEKTVKIRWWNRDGSALPECLDEELNYWDYPSSIYFENLSISVEEDTSWNGNMADQIGRPV